MTLNKGDLAVITGPLKLAGCTPGFVHLKEGEVVELLTGIDKYGDAVVWGRSTGIEQYIEVASLTPLAEIQDDPELDWGAVHDYVWEGED